MPRRSSSIPILISMLLGFAGCGHGEHGHGEHEAGHESHAPEPNIESQGSELQLTLNDGEKWQVDEHTRASAARLAETAGGAEPISSVEDARALGEALDTELDLLVQKCTMTGPAHDQLHVFLVALFPKVAALEEKTEVADLQRTREEIGSLLEAYGAHFE